MARYVLGLYRWWPAGLEQHDVCHDQRCRLRGREVTSCARNYSAEGKFAKLLFRANVFFYFIATGLVGNLVGAPLTFYLMEYGPWVATAVGYSCYVARLLVVLFLCHDMKRDAALLYHDDEPQPAVEDSDKSAVAAAFSTMLNPVLAIKQTWSAAVQVFWMHKKIGVLMLTLLFSDLGGYANILFNQYIAKRFDWSWSQVCLT